MNSGGYRNSAWSCRYRAPHCFHFPTLFCDSIFDRFWDLFGSTFELHVWWFSVFVASLFRAPILHCFCIDFDMICCIMLDMFLIPFPFAYATCETFKSIVFTMIFHDFTIREKMDVDNLNGFFRYQFWHRFLMSLGIDLGTICAPR